MDDNKVSVTLTGPAKVDGKRLPAGTTVPVSATLALQLAASGVINPDLAESLSNAFDMSRTLLAPDFERAVEAAVVDRVAAMKAEHFAEIQKIEARTTELEKQLTAAIERAETAEKALSEKVLPEKPAKSPK